MYNLKQNWNGHKLKNFFDQYENSITQLNNIFISKFGLRAEHKYFKFKIEINNFLWINIKIFKKSQEVSLVD